MTARILVIEDDPANMELMVYLLNAFGHTSVDAHDGTAGLALALEESPDLVICDVHLPLLDGYEVIRQMKNHPRLHHLPVIAVTALAMAGDRERLLAAGFDGYVSKPIEPEDFIEAIEQFLPATSPKNGSCDKDRAAATPVCQGTKPVTRVIRMLILSGSDDLQRRLAMGMEPSATDMVTVSSLAEAEAQLQQGCFDVALVAAGPGAKQLHHQLETVSATTSSGDMLPVLILQSSDTAEMMAGQIQACLQEQNRSPDGDHIDR